MSMSFDRDSWALILGGSSGFGLATAQKLARHGMNLAIVHRDRRGAMDRIEPQFAAMRAGDAQVATFNVDALSADRRRDVLDELTVRFGARGKVRLLLHSIAFGNLKLLASVPEQRKVASARCRDALASALGVPSESIEASASELFLGGSDLLAGLVDPPAYGQQLLEEEDFARTLACMGTSLATWTLDVFARGLFAPSARVIGLTSEGAERAFRGYAAVAAAKSAMASISRALALELAPYGVRSNLVQAGVTDTPALSLIPGNLQMMANARLRNPAGRLTTPADVADFIALLCTDEAAWVNGAVLCVDGGERISV